MARASLVVPDGHCAVAATTASRRAAIVALLVFYVIAPQCASTLIVVRRESGSWRWAAFLFVYLSVLAYVAALLAYRLASSLAG